MGFGAAFTSTASTAAYAASAFGIAGSCSCYCFEDSFESRAQTIGKIIVGARIVDMIAIRVSVKEFPCRGSPAVRSGFGLHPSTGFRAAEAR